MNIFQDKLEKKYFGMYRAQIKEVNVDVKNGIYKICAFPMMSGITDPALLPNAQSNLTTAEKHVNLYVDDYVWVFFENGNPNYPVIFSRCNVKDHYPVQATGEEPNYYNDIQEDSEIDEDSVSYNGEYNKVCGFDFPVGDNAKIHVEIDEENMQVILISDNWQVILDKDKKGHLTFADLWIKTDTKFNVHAGSNILKLDNDGIYLEAGGAGKIKIKNALKSLRQVLEEMCDHIVDLKTIGPPPQHTLHADSTAFWQTIKNVTIPMIFGSD